MTRLILSGRSDQMSLGFTICSEMLWNGVKIPGITAMRMLRMMRALGWSLEGTIGWLGAAVSGTCLQAAGRRIAITGHLVTVETPIGASASPRRFASRFYTRAAEIFDSLGICVEHHKIESFRSVCNCMYGKARWISTASGSERALVRATLATARGTDPYKHLKTDLA